MSDSHRMTVRQAPARRARVRTIVSRSLAGLTAAFLLIGNVPVLLGPWDGYVPGPPVAHPAEHAWHGAIAAGADVLVARVLAARTRSAATATSR
jgi:hypothetical protein